jgi:hypothetical protein
MASSEKTFRDFIIGEVDEEFRALPMGKSPHDPDDFLLGYEEATPNAGQSLPHPLRTPSKTMTAKSEANASAASELDFTSIGDLIEDELDIPLSQKKAPISPRAFTPKLAVSPEPLAKGAVSSHHVQAQPIKELGVDLGEDQKTLTVAQGIHDQILNDLQGYSDARKPLAPSSQQRQAIRDMLHQYQEQIREEQSTLQDLIGSYIRDGEFERVATVDKVKRQLDSLLLQIRVLDNRLISVDSVLENKGGVENKAPSLLPEPSTGSDENQTRNESIDQYRSALGKKPAKGKAKAKAKIKKTYRDPGMPSVWGRHIKLVLITLIFLSTIPAYYLSANWGVQKIIAVDVDPYLSVIPLEKASRSGNTFNGIIQIKWRDLPKEEREDAIRQLMAMVKVEGFEAIYLRYSDGAMATMVHTRSERIFIQ